MDAQPQPNEVRTQLLNLQHLAMPELTEKWKLLFHKKPPEYGEVFMRRRLAHRIQELAYGGLSDAAQKKLNSVNEKIRRTHSGLRVGTVIVRTWRDSKYEVRVCKDGFEWNGQLFNSLSATARAITGVNRNGYEFFGIKDKI
ncbi:hypothetical protein SDC9_71382 [bioreactor metagenome]|uniref:DUF2924 domain-containing protein n=1 Tax=bioreactor metagenome TaxID=1076179 RepID=A0A644YFK5_9ZZZZ